MPDGYDYEPEVGGGLFLRLKEKGQQVTIRLAATPLRELQIWKEGETKPMDQEKVAALSPDQLETVKLQKTAPGLDGKTKPLYKLSQLFTWIVIDREDGQAKTFTGPVSIYSKIKKYAQEANWGDVSTYDFTITRLELPGAGYYDVMANPNKSALTPEEIEAAKAVDVFAYNEFAHATSENGAIYIAGEAIFPATQEVAASAIDL